MPDTAAHSQPPLELSPEPAARPRPVAVGDQVISWHCDDPVRYGGPCDGPFFRLIVSGSGLVLMCDPADVAPADTPVPAKDDRVQVDKRSRADMPDMPYGQPGQWHLAIGSSGRTSWHKTKRDATATGLRRIAILDWHARLAAHPS